MRQIRRFSEALAAVMSGRTVPAQDQLDELVRDAVGLRVGTLDALSADALFALGARDDDRWRERVLLIAAVLEQLPDAEDRIDKARRLRELAT